MYNKATFKQNNLISDIGGSAQVFYDNLQNPWGAVTTENNLFWVSINGNGTLAAFDQYGTLKQTVQTFNNTPPTGLVLNTGDNFKITSNNITLPSKLITVTEAGSIEGYNDNVDLVNTVLVLSNADAVYKGAAIHNNHLYVANFRSGFIEKYDDSFNLVSTLTDESLQAAGYAPFNVYSNKNQLFVTFALKDFNGEDDVKGLGNGYIDVFENDIPQRIFNRGPLNSPWGLYKYHCKLYVGNFGDGVINVFSLRDNSFLGPLKDKNGNTISIDGLWSLSKGPEYAWNKNLPFTLWFTAGSQNEEHGLIGTLSLNNNPIKKGHGYH